jgi:hypothetical protein
MFNVPQVITRSLSTLSPKAANPTAQGVQQGTTTLLSQKILNVFKARQEAKQLEQDVVRLTAVSRETRV